MPKPPAACSLALIVAIAVAWPCAAAAAEGERPVVNVGVVYDGPQPQGGVVLLERRDAVREMIVEETLGLTRRDFDVRFPADKLVVGDWTVEGVRAAVDRLMSDDEVDIVLSLGPFATDELAARGPLPKPSIGAWAIDRAAQQLPGTGDTTGVANFNYLITPGSMLRDLAKFRDLVNFATVHVLADSRLLEVLPEVPANVERMASALGIELVIVHAEDLADPVLAALPDDAEAVYVTPMLRMPIPQHRRLLDGLIDRKLPSFSLLGRDEVARGVLACLRTGSDLSRLSRRVALNIQRILLGENPAALPVTLESPERLVINMATARAIDVFPRWRILLEAELINDVPVESGRLLTFEGAVEEAIERNLSLRIADREVAAGAEDVVRARSTLLPQLQAFARGTRIDEDRAAASFGSQAESTGTAGVSLTQLIYSDGARAGLEISRRVQQSREWDRESTRLDIALEAAQAYLDVLRAQTLMRIEEDNLRLTESNLELARRRERIGASGPAEVYRWESRLATARSDRIASENRVFAARIVLNRLLHRPLEEPFTTEAPGLEESWLITCCQRIDPFVNNPISYEIFRRFLVGEGLRNSVELQSLDAAVTAQERALLAARRSVWSPEVGLQGSYDRDFYRDGAGSMPPMLFPGLTADRDDWSVSVQASLPLFTGGSRSAEIRQATEELARLGVQRQALAESIELRIRLALFEAGTTHPAMELAEEAATAARKNLELVTDAYSRGVLSIIDLLDAQNAALSAEQVASNAVYDFLLDLMEAQRASNTFDFFRSDEARDAWFRRLDEFFAEADYAAPPPWR